MVLQQMFLNLIEEAFDETVKAGRDSLDEEIKRIRRETFERAGKDFQSLNGLQLDPYIEGIRSADYLSMALRERGAASENPPSSIEESPRITYKYVRQVVPGLLLEHGYVSAKLIAPGTARTAGRMLSVLSEELGITSGPNSKADDKRYIPAAGGAPKKEAVTGGADSGKPSITYDYLQRVVPGIIAEHGYVSAKLVAPETAGPAGHLLSHFSGKLGITRDPATKKGDRHYLATRPTLTEQVIDRYITRLIEVTQEKDRFLATDIDPDHPELFEELMYSQVVGNGTFMEKEGLTAKQIKGKNVFYFKRETVDSRESDRTYRVEADGRLILRGERPDPDYPDRIGR